MKLLQILFQITLMRYYGDRRFTTIHAVLFLWIKTGLSKVLPRYLESDTNAKTILSCLNITKSPTAANIRYVNIYEG